MIEFLTFAFTPAVILFTVLLCVVLLYWLVVIVGLLDTEFLNFDLHGDVGAEVDVDGDVDADAGDVGGAEGMAGAFRTMLAFFYLGRVPVTILATLMVFSMWTLVMLVNHTVNPSGGFLLGLPVAAGAIFVSLFVVKVVGWPFAKLYAAMHANPGQLDNVVGRMCVLLTSVEPGRTGQAEVTTTGAPAVVNVVCEPGQSLARGDEAVILEYRGAANVYLIAPVDVNE